MKKIFIIVMLVLLPLQYSWALAANYDFHAKQDNHAHFGHHNHNIEHPPQPYFICPSARFTQQ